MAVNRCSTCALNYPATYGGLCLECDGKLDRLGDTDDAMSEDEFKAKREAKRVQAGDPPRVLNQAEQAALEKDLNNFLTLYGELEAEAARRGPRWTPPDIFEERRRHAA